PRRCGGPGRAAPDASAECGGGMSTGKPDDRLTPAEAAVWLRLGESTVRKWVTQGRLGGEWVEVAGTRRRALLVHRQDVERLARERAIRPAPRPPKDTGP